MFAAESKNDHFKRTRVCIGHFLGLSDYKDEKKPCFVRNQGFKFAY